MDRVINVIASWDDESKIWYATSEDVVGLHVCCSTLDEVIEVVDDVLPELVSQNLDDNDALEFIPYHLMHKHVTKVIH